MVWWTGRRPGPSSSPPPHPPPLPPGRRQGRGDGVLLVLPTSDDGLQRCQPPDLLAAWADAAGSQCSYWQWWQLYRSSSLSSTRDSVVGLLYACVCVCVCVEGGGL